MNLVRIPPPYIDVHPLMGGTRSHMPTTMSLLVHCARVTLRDLRLWLRSFPPMKDRL